MYFEKHSFLKVVESCRFLSSNDSILLLLYLMPVCLVLQHVDLAKNPILNEEEITSRTYMTNGIIFLCLTGNIRPVTLGLKINDLDIMD